MSNLSTIRVGSSEYGTASYLTLVNTALHGSMYEQKTLNIVNHKNELHKQTIKNNIETNNNDASKWNKQIINSTQKLPIANTDYKNETNIIPKVIVSIPQNSEHGLNIFNMSAASSHNNSNMTIIKPLDKDRKKKKQIEKENIYQISEKDNVSLLIFWEFQLSKEALINN